MEASEHKQPGCPDFYLGQYDSACMSAHIRRRSAHPRSLSWDDEVGKQSAPPAVGSQSSDLATKESLSYSCFYVMSFWVVAFCVLVSLMITTECLLSDVC